MTPSQPYARSVTHARSNEVSASCSKAIVAPLSWICRRCRPESDSPGSTRDLGYISAPRHGCDVTDGLPHPEWARWRRWVPRDRPGDRIEENPHVITAFPAVDPHHEHTSCTHRVHGNRCNRCGGARSRLCAAVALRTRRQPLRFARLGDVGGWGCDGVGLGCGLQHRSTCRGDVLGGRQAPPRAGRSVGGPPRCGSSHRSCRPWVQRHPGCAGC